MAEFIVTAPDGKKYRVRGEGTREQALAAFQAQWKPEAPEPLGSRMKRENPAEYDPTSPDYKYKDQLGPGKPNALVRFAHGAYETVQGARQLGNKLTGDAAEAEQITRRTNNADELYQQGRGPDAGIDWMSILGSGAQSAPLAVLPGGPATFLGRMAGGAIAGGGAGVLQFDPENKASNRVENALTGAVAGAAIAPVAGAVADKIPAAARAVVGRLKGTLERLRGNATPQAIAQAVPELAQLQQANPAAFRDLIAEAQQMLQKTGTLDEVQIARKANLLANEVQPTKSMVTRDPADWSVERNLQKLAQSPDEQLAATGQRLTDVYQTNDAALTRRLDTVGGRLPAGTTEQQGMTVMKALDDLSKGSQKEVGAIYEQVRQVRGADLASDARSLVSKLEELQDSTYSEKLVSSVRNKLRRFGMLDAEGNLTSKSLTVDQAEELRKFVNTLPNDFGKREIIRAIDEDVLSGLGDDAFGGARAAAAERFAMLDNPATQRALNTLGELQQGKTAQNFIRSQVIGAAEQDVATLVSTIGKIPDPAARAKALDALKAGVMEHLRTASVRGPSGGQQFSGAALDKALREIGEAKLDLIFGAQQAGQLRNLARAAVDATYQPPFSAVNHSNTAPMLLSLTQRARSVPGVPLIVSEEAQKLAARSGYQGQLADVLAARAGQQRPTLTEIQRRLAGALGTATGVGGAAAVQELRKPPAKRNHQ